MLKNYFKPIFSPSNIKNMLGDIKNLMKTIVTSWLRGCNFRDLFGYDNHLWQLNKYIFLFNS